jgi:sugar lactone lactonase YvrE
MTDPETLFSGYRFPEGCRWHDGRLWFSDMHTGTVYTADITTREVTEVMSVDDQPSGIGWLPDGSMVLSSMLQRKVLRRSPDGRVSVLCDLSQATPYPINDLIVDRTGRVIVGGFGYDLYAEAEAEGGSLFGVRPDGGYDVLADDLVFPNGMAILSTGVLVVAETFGTRLTAFDIAPGGSLTGRRVWAELPEGSTPDGICADADDGIWISSILPGRFLRVLEGGEVTDDIQLDGRLAVDCVLGGPDGRSLLLSTADSWQPDDTAKSWLGRIEILRTRVAGVE